MAEGPARLALATPTFGALVGIAALAVRLLWTTPISPFALGEGDVVLGRGHAEDAAARYDAIAEWNPIRSVRQEASYRAAVLHAVDLGDPEGAKERLKTLLVDARDYERRAEAWERLAELYQEGASPDLTAAGSAYLKAWRSDTAAPRAEQRLVEAARAFADAGDGKRADQLWARVAATYPAQRALALIGRAEVALGQGDAARALSHYQSAQKAAWDPEVATLARMGAAGCLERLGDLDEALAEVERTELPEAVKQARRAGILGRKDARLSP